jgi:anti-sigma regulatory factor (Ser/Thr protein kinase)
MKKSRAFPKDATSVAAARRFVAEVLPDLPTEAGETVILLVSELVTNAIVHAESEVKVTVAYRIRSALVRVEVNDGSRTRPIELRPSSTTPHGRGVQLVGALSDEWGVRQARGRSGKTVWFELSAAPLGPGGKRNLQTSEP